MNKKKTWILAGVIVLIAAALILWFCCGGKSAPDIEPEETEPTEEAQPEETAAETEKAPAEEPAEESAESAQLIESEGDLIITIPEDEESDGF